MTEDEAFAAIGLSSARKWLHPPPIAFHSGRWNTTIYQLHEGDILTLRFDCEGADWQKDPAATTGTLPSRMLHQGSLTNCTVIEAQLGPDTWSAKTGLANSATVLAADARTPVSLEHYLRVVGGTVGCHFTLEYRGYGLTSKPSPLAIAVTNDAGVDSISSLITKLRRDLHEFQVSEDSHCPTVIHIIQRQLADDKQYILNKRIHLTYSGHLGGCESADSSRNLAKDPGLTAAIGQVIEGIRDGSDESGSQATFSDCVTRVSIKAKDQSVRNIMTACIPLASYDTILWRVVTTKEWLKTKEEGKPVALVQFFGSHPTASH
jgi:hypothetical protein